MKCASRCATKAMELKARGMAVYLQVMRHKDIGEALQQLRMSDLTCKHSCFQRPAVNYARAGQHERSEQASLKDPRNQVLSHEADIRGGELGLCSEENREELDRHPAQSVQRVQCGYKL
eukprot:411054-Pelagomonas_calceolata.AAC.2